VVPAVLLHIDTEIAHRQAQVRADWARSRPVPGRDDGGRAPARRGLRGRAARLLHA
jgi:hypothetical protein